MIRSRGQPPTFNFRRKLRLGALLAVCAVVIPSISEGRPASDPPLKAPSEAEEPECILHLVAGRQLSAHLISRSDNEVVVRIGSIPTAFKRSEIDRLEILPPALDRYRVMREAIDDSDVPSLMVLVDWLRARDLYAEAVAELDHVLELEPGNSRARQMRSVLEQHRELAERTAPPASTTPRQPNPTPRPVRAEFPFLTPDDINILKVYEIDLAKPPRMRVDRETIQDLITAYIQSDLIPTSKEGRDALLRQSPDRILDLMFRLRAREFYSRVKVIDQPESMKLFRDEVHASWLINACATDRCHGGSEAGRLMLYNRSRNGEAAVYTNFLILDRARLSDGTPLINYDQPQRSPLLHLALPRERSLYPHPETLSAKGWKPVFTSQKDRRFEETLEWIRSMYRPRPEYPINYTPPTGESLIDPEVPAPRDPKSPEDPSQPDADPPESPVTPPDSDPALPGSGPDAAPPR